MNTHAPTMGSHTPPLDVEAIRRDFPILETRVHGRPLVYLDNAATSQKPLAVVDAIRDFYLADNSNVHRGVHELSQRATRKYEAARETVKRFLGAKDTREIVWVRGTTEGINLVAQAFARPRLGEGDEVLISAMEHHSNIVPWQLVCRSTGSKLKVIPMTQTGELDLTAYEKLLGSRTKVVAVGHVSNALGTINDLRTIITKAHAVGVPVVVDGAQAVPHMAVDVRELDCDFYAFSGHKVFGPTGIGALYGKLEHLQSMDPWQGGGDMIASVTFQETTFNEVPHKFEAGTPDIAGAIGLAAAIDYIEGMGLDRITAYEHHLLDVGTRALEELGGIRILGTAAQKASVLSFVVDGVHPHDVGTILDREGVAVRAGHHCAQPVMDYFGVPATVRASLAFYNTAEEILALTAGLRKVQEMFA